MAHGIVLTAVGFGDEVAVDIGLNNGIFLCFYHLYGPGAKYVLVVLIE